MEIIITNSLWRCVSLWSSCTKTTTLALNISTAYPRNSLSNLETILTSGSPINSPDVAQLAEEVTYDNDWSYIRSLSNRLEIPGSYNNHRVQNLPFAQRKLWLVFFRKTIILIKSDIINHNHYFGVWQYNLMFIYSYKNFEKMKIEVFITKSS